MTIEVTARASSAAIVSMDGRLFLWRCSKGVEMSVLLRLTDGGGSDQGDNGSFGEHFVHYDQTLARRKDPDHVRLGDSFSASFSVRDGIDQSSLTRREL